MSEASGIPAWAVRGAKVVCVNANYADGEPTGLVVGKVYTVRAAGIDADAISASGHRSRHPVVDLEECQNRYDCYAGPNGHPGFDITRFRPAVPPKTQSEDVGLFRHHLDDVRANA